MPGPKAKDINEYIAGFPEETREVLEHIRCIIHEVCPEAQEAISYAIPAFLLNKTYLVYFAGYKKHVSLYPIPKSISAAFDKKITPHKAGKGTLQFQLDKPLPVTLIREVVKYSLKDNAERTKKKQKKS